MLSRRAAFSLAGGAVLAASLGLKAVLLDVSRPDVPRYNRGLAALLAQQGFSVGIEHRADVMGLVVARRGDCRLKARTEETADRRQSFLRLTPGLPVVRYRYRGEFLQEFPRTGYIVRSLFERIALRLHLVDAVERPLAIAASPSCDLAAIDFGDQRIAIRLPASR